MIFMIIALAVILPAGGVLVWFNSLPYKKRATFFRNMYFYAYRFLSSFFLTSKSTAKIHRKISLLSVYRSEDIQTLTVWYFITATAASGAIAAGGLILFSDIAARLLIVVLAVIFRTVMIDKQLEKTYLNVLKETNRALSEIAQGYMKTKSIPDALSEVKSELLTKPVDEIHMILTGSESELRLQQFYASMPFRPLQTLAVVCYNINLYGDSVNGNNTSGFMQAITILKSDVNAEIEKIELTKAKSGIMEYLTLIAVSLIAPIEIFLTSSIPGLALMYNGMSGLLFRAAVISAAIVSFTVISRLRGTTVVKEDDRGIWAESLVLKKSWRKFVTGFAPKNPKTQSKIELKLRKAQSKMKFTHYYTKKVTFAVSIFLVSSLLIVLSINLGKDFARNTTAQLSLIAGKEKTADEIKAIRIMDEIYFELLELEGNLPDSELQALIRRYLTNLTDMQTQDEMKRMKDKYSTWSNLYFHWYYILITFALGIAGWLIPDIMLKVRAFLIRNATEDDYMQLQTLVSVLTFTELDTLSILRQMEQHSTVHKDILLEAYHGFPSAPEMELDRLKSKIALPEFKWFIDKLKLTVSELPMKDAFSDLVSERESLTRLRRIAMEASVTNKANFARILMIMPMILLAAAEFIIPIGYLGGMQFMDALGQLRG